MASLVVAVWVGAVAESWVGVAIAAAGLGVLGVWALADRRTTTVEMSRRATSLERVAAEQARRSQIDPLTDLPNRQAIGRRLAEEVERAVRYQQPLALCFIDVDHFKSVNDGHGHAVGDEVLAAIAGALRSTARTIDLVGRFGGEEFVVIAPGTWSSDGLILADRLRRQVSSLRRVGVDGRLTISVGVAGLPEHATSSEMLLRRADEALYEAKRAGRDCARVSTVGAITSLS